MRFPKEKCYCEKGQVPMIEFQEILVLKKDKGK